MVKKWNLKEYFYMSLLAFCIILFAFSFCEDEKIFNNFFFKMSNYFMMKPVLRKMPQKSS